MEIKGDFLGFSFAGVRSEDLGIVRTSDGDYYEENLHSEIKDITAEIPGMNGEYFFGSTYGTKTHSISFAFDSMTEEQFRTLRKTFGRRNVGELIFDERPYKKYIAKIESPIELSYVCFDEPYTTIGGPRDGVRVVDRDGDTITREQVTPFIKDYSRTRRIYKGEGKIEFISYFPFAKSAFKVLSEADKDSDWAVSSGILNSTEYLTIDKYIPAQIDPEEEGEEPTTDWSQGVINIYNAGDVPTGFRLYIPAESTTDEITLSYKPTVMDNIFRSILQINPITLNEGDEGILIDTNNGLIVGVKNYNITMEGNSTYETTGNLYNKYVKSGFFFQFEPNLKNDGATLEIEGGVEGIEIFYDYLYF